MTNLLGPQHIITTFSETYVINEQQFVGEKGYVRTMKDFPRVGLTSNGNINYRQADTPVPLHKFQWDVVMQAEEAYKFIADVEAQMFAYKNNNDRNFIPFTLNDQKLGILPDALPAGADTSPIDSGWVFAEFYIVFKSIEFNTFGQNKLRLKITAEQVIV